MSWNKPSGAPKPEPKKPSAMRGIIAGGVIVLAACAALFFLFSGNDAAPKAKPDKGRGRIKVVKEASPAPAPTNAVPAKPVDPREDYDHEKFFRNERGDLCYKANPDLRAYDPSLPRHKPIVLGSSSRPPLFKFQSENEIAAIIDAVPGERRMISPNYYDPEFIDDFESSLPVPIEIKDTDLPHEKELKKAVAAVKDEIAVRVGKGEKLADILTDAKRELERLAEYKETLKDELDTIVRGAKGEISSDDVIDYVKAANKMLEENGINPVEPDEFVMWNVRIAAERSGATSEEADAAETAAEKRLEKLRNEKKGNRE